MHPYNQIIEGARRISVSLPAQPVVTFLSNSVQWQYEVMTPVPVQTGIELPYFYRPSSELVIGLALLRPGMKSEDCNIDAESCNLCITDVQRNQRVLGNGNFFAFILGYPNIYPTWILYLVFL